MSDWGVFAVARDIWDHPLFQGEAFTRREAWMWLVSAAAWKPIRVAHRSGIAHIERGEFCFSIRFLSGKWQWLIGRVERFLNLLEKHDMIRDTSRDASKIYLINNYNKFQIVGMPKRDAQREEVETDARRSQDKEETFKHSNIETLTSDKSDPRPKKYPDQFEVFWKAYPTDKLMSKAKAGAHWAKLSPEDRALAIAAIPGFREHCRKNPTYRAVHAVRFLSERRFEGFTSSAAADPEKTAALKDRADQLMRRGKYAEAAE
jgi:hypothetical protein